MSEGSQSFTAQGSSSHGLDQSFEKEKAPVVTGTEQLESASIYDGGKAAWLTVAGTYVTSSFFFPRCKLTDIFARTTSWMIQFCTYG